MIRCLAFAYGSLLLKRNIRRILGGSRNVVIIWAGDHRSKTPADVERAYEAGISSFVVKPVDFDKFSAAVQAIASYWTVWNKAALLEG